ncbi:hypothetical protein J6590_026284 [Homalodisca vitripennis]|nr:hypothetical protein J6590_026284 [Homalodisca vitripennis]
MSGINQPEVIPPEDKDFFVKRKNHSTFNLTVSIIVSLCEDLTKQNEEENWYSARLTVLIKSAKVSDRTCVCAISNSDPQFDALDTSGNG